MSETQSAAAAKFYSDTGNMGKVNPGKALGETFQRVQESCVPANITSEIYMKNTGAFVGDDVEVRSSGSVFNRNKNEFYGVD